MAQPPSARGGKRGTGQSEPGPQRRVLGTQYSVHSAQYSVLSTQYSVLGTPHPVLSTRCSVLSARYSVRGTRYTVLSTQYSVLRTSRRVLRTASSATLRLLPLLAALLSPGCIRNDSDAGRVVAVWGRPGISDGRFQTPRAIAIDRDQQLYIVDKTARIQVFKSDGTFLRSWTTPDHANGKPTGMSFDRDGNLMVADTHYFEVLVYSPQGKLLRTLGGKKGEKPGEFGFVTGTAQDSHGNLYVSEYGEFDRIQKFTRDGRFLLQWGGHGSEAGHFVRPQRIVFDADDHLWVTDAGNHRIQVFDTEGKLLKLWGKEGKGPGELYYPYDIALAPNDTLYICEYGNHRIQKFTRDGRSLGCWGHEGRGREPGELNNPWSVVRDKAGLLYVLDTNNHRVQCVRFD